MNRIYNEPEFKVIISKSEDVITTSAGTQTGILPSGRTDWETGDNNDMQPFVGS